MASLWFLATAGGGSKVYLPFDPSPLPVSNPERVVIEEKVLPSKVGGSIVAGPWVSTDLGADPTDQLLTVESDIIDATTKGLVDAKYAGSGPLQFGRDGGPVYLVAWRPGASYVSTIARGIDLSGTCSVYTVRLSFRILQVLG